MKWSIAEENGVFHLLINNIRARTEKGSQNEIATAAMGNKRREIWFRFKDIKKGKRLSLEDFEENESTACTSKLKLCHTSSQFLKELQASGLTILSRDRANKGITDIHKFPDIDPSPTCTTSADMFKEKLSGTDTVDIRRIKPSPPKYQIRKVSMEWVAEIKNRLRSTGNIGIMTQIPVIENEEGYISLGGNHLTEAVRQLVEEDAERFDHLRKISVDVYQDLSETECLRLAALHNAATETKKLLFQERVRLAHKIKVEQGEGWRKEVVKTLSLLDGKRHTNQSLSTLLATANLDDPSYNAAESLWADFEVTSNGSFPVQLFRSIQTLKSPESKLKYLQAAQGTNGLRTSRQLAEDRHRENVKELSVAILQVKDWKEAEDKIGQEKATLIQEYKGTIATMEGRHRFRRFVIGLQNRQPCIRLKLEVDGKDVSHKYTDLLEKHLGLLQKEIKLEE